MMKRYTLIEWLRTGHIDVQYGADAVELTDREPVKDGNGYGWRTGPEWMDNSALAKHTLPHDIFHCLDGSRWDTAADAMKAVSAAAVRWAWEQVRLFMGGRAHA